MLKVLLKSSTKTKWHWKMELSMADRDVIKLIHETLKCGELRKIKNNGVGHVLIKIVFCCKRIMGLCLS